MKSIEINNLSKIYNLGSIGYGMLYKDLQSSIAKLFGKDDPNSVVEENIGLIKKGSLVALKNINLEIKKGEIVGLIGANGAGKSTLLKILSRITFPTTGEAKLYGRAASLLEVGTGFHPELTGRENIFLNGTINGMTKFEIDKKLEEIVDFAGINRFLDTPVKRYSSGMYVKLGFAIAANLTQEILLVDEVLAVGDQNFRKKAINKMNELSLKNDRTLIFVSHNMQSIQNLCSRTILLKKGKVFYDGETGQAIKYYYENLKNLEINNNTGLGSYKFRRGNGNARFESLKILNLKDKDNTTFEEYEKPILYFKCRTFEDIDNLRIKVALKSLDTGEFISAYKEIVLSNKSVKKGKLFEGKIEINLNNIIPNTFNLIVYLGDKSFQGMFDLIDGLLPPLAVINSQEEETKGFFKLDTKLIEKND